MPSLRTLSVVALLLAVAVPGVRADEPPAMTAADVERLVGELSNWGRWGDDDELGTLNLITPEKRVAAARLVTEGVSISLAHDVEKEPAVDNAFPFGHRMLSTGAGDGPWAMDEYRIAYHGIAHTHMDALCHLFYRGRMYNGFPRGDVTETGAKRLHIGHAKQGIFTRGVLIDVCRLQGVEYLEPGTAILPADLDAWERRTGVKIGSGDVVLVRTGKWARREKMGPWDPSKDGLAGMHASCAKWFRDRDVAMVGSDAASDVIPSRIEGITHPVHVLLLHAMGTPIFDNCDLRELSTACESRQRWTFLLTASPLAVPGGTGSPLNPIATF
jgi:kynurenine formamidase